MDMLFKLGVLMWVQASKVPQEVKRISTKMVYKYKVAMPGVPPRYKCRLVAKGFMECKSEYGDSFAQVVRHETVRAFMASAAAQDEDLCSIDVCSAFCTAPINRTVFIKPPKGFERPGYELQLGKNLYGLVSAPAAYHKDFDKFLGESQIFPDRSDTCLYVSRNTRYLGLQIIEYVDDLILKGSKLAINNFKQDIQTKYEIRDYGAPQSFLGMEVQQDRERHTITLTQQA